MNKYGDKRAGGNRDPMTFREWLVEQLKLSRWSVKRSERVSDAAKRLGVQEDALQQAIDERARDIKLHSKREIAEQCQITVWIPGEVYAAFTEYAQLIKVTPAMLLRSLINRFLLEPSVTPMMLDRRWFYRGKRYGMSKASRHNAKCRLPRGAQQALDHHARLHRIPTASVLKGLVLDLLEGRITRLKLVIATDMWADPKRYLQPELFQQTQEKASP